MRRHLQPRPLPRHPHIDHLKKQAKDLLDAHRQGEAEALERVAGLPAFAKLSPAQIAEAPFALHDAQSVVAREYGFPSWNELRAEVERRASTAVPDSFLRALVARSGVSLPGAVADALAEAWDGRGADKEPGAGEVATLPLVAFRDALLTPGAVAPIHVARAPSVAAVDAALASTPARLAVFTQIDPAEEQPAAANLYPVGCVALAVKRIAAQPGTVVVVQGLWWAQIEAHEAAGPEGHATVRVRPFVVHEDLDGQQRASLEAALRASAHRLARTMPQPERVVALVDSIDAPGRLADLLVANLPLGVAEKARYAAEATLGGRLRAAIALCDAQLAAASR